MLFNSIEFLVFLPIVFILYWLVLNSDYNKQNILLLLSGFVFYGWWDWRFLVLLVFMATGNYFLGLKIESGLKHGRSDQWLITGLIFNIGVLSFFKYYNFFIDSFIDLISITGYEIPRSSTRIVLPIGISFYTFLSLSYLIDIYKRNIKAHNNALEVILSLSFFPIILAGPIQRPSRLIPQISTARIFDSCKMTEGLRQILWGLFKKIVLADTCAANADYIFNNYDTLQGGALVMGVVFFAFQIYGDFSGYSDMSIGLARLFGFDLIRNFAFPYFARDIADFWHRWHISLTTWFRDYLFLPISVFLAHRFTSQKILYVKTELLVYIIACGITWFFTGLWHGANYTFLLWGLIHAFFLILLQSQRKFRKRFLNNIGISNDHVLIVSLETLLTLIVVYFAWIFFRAPSVSFAFSFIKEMFESGVLSISILDLRGRGISSTLIDGTIAIIVVIIIEWLQRKKEHGLEIGHYPLPLRWGFYWGIAFLCLLYMGDERIFIYFQY